MIEPFDVLAEGYLAGDLPPAELERFEAHLKECPPCRERMKSHKVLVGRLSSLSAMALIPISVGFTQRVMSGLPSTPPGHQPPRSGAGGKALALAGTLAVVVGFSVALKARHAAPVVPPGFQVSGSAAPVGETVTARKDGLVLTGPGGFKAVLDANTALVPEGDGKLRLTSGSATITSGDGFALRAGPFRLKGSASSSCALEYDGNRLTMSVRRGSVGVDSPDRNQQVTSADGIVTLGPPVPSGPPIQAIPSESVGSFGGNKLGGSSKRNK